MTASCVRPATNPVPGLTRDLSLLQEAPDQVRGGVKGCPP
jgi:hypothetical protein